MMILRVVFLIIFVPTMMYSDVAPYFPLVSHSFVLNPLNSDELSFVFNSKALKKSDKVGFAIAHQNREWEYNWFVVASVIPSPIGHFGIGYSNYGLTSVPVTKEDVFGAYIDSYSSDTFQNLALSFSPALTWVDFTFSANYKYRKLVNQSAKALSFDIKVSSPRLLNNQVGVQTKNLIGSDYEWNSGSTSGNNVKEELPQYVGVYYIQPVSNIGDFTIILENDFCLNYDHLTTSSGGLSIQVDQFIRIFFSYQKSSILEANTFGSEIKLSDLFQLKYANRNESNDNQELAIHSIGIGVKF